MMAKFKLESVDLKYYLHKVATVGLTGFVMLALSMSAFAKPFTSNKTSKKAIKNKIKISRLKAEVEGGNFVPTIQMLKLAPDLVKREVELYRDYDKKMSLLQKDEKQLDRSVKAYQASYDEGIVSVGELRMKAHQLNAVKSKIYKLRTKVLSQLENELVRRSQTSNNAEWVQKVRVARVNAEVEHKEFKPSEEMLKNAPDMVKVEKQLYQAHLNHVKALNARIKMAKNEVDLAKQAYETGAISKMEFLQIQKYHNELSNVGLALQAKILRDDENIKLAIAAQQKNQWAQKVKLARLKAEIEQKAFTPTAEMKEHVPHLVLLEQQLYETRQAQLTLLQERETILKERYQVVTEAHQSGVLAKSELNKVSKQITAIQKYLKDRHHYVQYQYKVAMAGR